MTRQEWERSTLAAALASVPDRRPDAATSSGRPVPLVCTADDLPEPVASRPPADASFIEVTRTGGPWLIHEPVGRTTPELTNIAIGRALERGADGVEIHVDQLTRRGRDPDPAEAADVGAGGVSLSMAADVEALLEGVSLPSVPMSIVAGDAGIVVLAFLLVAAERVGASWTSIRGAVIHDVFADVAAGEARPRSGLPVARLRSDSLSFCATHAARVRPVVITGNSLRDAGGSAQLELSSVVRAAVTEVEASIERGGTAAGAGQGLGLAFGTGEFFEEIARLRAARRVWSTLMRDRFGVASGDVPLPLILTRRSTAGDGASQWDTVTRAAFQYLASVLGGADQADGDRTAASPAGGPAMAARTAQVIRHESGLAAEHDPLRGAWFVERLTQDFVDQTHTDLQADGRLRDSIRSLVRPPAPDRGRERPTGTADLDRDDDLVERRIDRVRDWRLARNAATVREALAGLRESVRGDRNVMEALVSGARVDLTIGEMCDVLRQEAERS